MGNNTQSTQPRHELSSSLSLDDGASDFAEGEYVLLGIPDSIVVDGHLGDEATADTALPPTSNGSSPQNFAFIHQMNILLDGDWVLEVYPVVSFTSSGGALGGYDLINDAAKRRFSRSHLCQLISQRLRLSELHLRLEVEKPSKIHGLVSFQGGSL